MKGIMDMGKTRYIAYGSNLNLDQMAHRCPTAKVVGTAELEGYELLFRGSHGCAVATVEKKVDSSVPVLIWELEPQDEAALDRYEGYPYLYRKEWVTVEHSGKPTKVMVYIMNDGRPLGAPGNYYYEVVRDGYMTAGFDTSLLRKAAKRSRVAI